MDKATFIAWARQQSAMYVQSNETKLQLSKVDLIAIVGPTGVGKSTLIEKMGIPYVMGDVSRVKRPDEKNDKSYHFRTDYDQIAQDILNGEYVQFLTSRYDEFYGTRRVAYPTEGTCTMAIIASVMPQFRRLGFRSVRAIYVMPPSYVEWMRRIGGVRREDLIGRINEARESILLAQADASQYHFVLNDNIDLALRDIATIMAGGEPDAHRAQLAYDTADIILERIGDAQ